MVPIGCVPLITYSLIYFLVLLSSGLWNERKMTVQFKCPNSSTTSPFSNQFQGIITGNVGGTKKRTHINPKWSEDPAEEDDTIYIYRSQLTNQKRKVPHIHIFWILCLRIYWCCFWSCLLVLGLSAEKWEKWKRGPAFSIKKNVSTVFNFGMP